MQSLEFGTTLRSPRNVVQQARLVESLGYDILGCGEHVSFHGESANGIVSLSVAAGATERIKLMSTITLVPLYPAALLAKLGAALDVASNGRFLLGVGVGGEYPPEFEACGVPVKERGARTNEALQLIHQLWTNADVTFEGRFTTVRNFSLAPRPVQKPRPPIWVSGRREAAMKRAARHADGWLPYMYTPERLAGSLESIHAFGADIGRDMSRFTPGLYIFTAVHEHGPTAVDMAADMLSKQYAQDFSTLVSKYALAGTPEQCRSRLQEYIDAGARTFILSAACPDDYMERNLELIAKEIVAPFR